ncbi:dipeptidase [Geomicrobium sp. JCM 19038]|uniref:dipeptidase n=1 Tax=Geomicrobium sp. JCM 19038 TaxID=1460635 RepID=UPI00045F400E|nr:membrane dipeptidase [Geomicrobium sp. JCM 19038]GAK09065.1 renal dipeptidase family protein [Geomicrobium sp. JCM 19038]
MFIADGHCDATLRQFEAETPSFTEGMTITESSLREGQVNMQLFALFAPVYDERADLFDSVLRQVDHFYNLIVSNEQVVFAPCTPLTEMSKTRAILALEGADGLQDDWMKWRLMKRLGVESVGLTWNEGNGLAAGCMEERGHGLTNKGREVVTFLRNEGMIVDGAHLHDDSYFEAASLSDSFFVSHANSRTIHNHPRNLTEEQLRVIKEKNSLVGMTFFPKFINGSEKATFADLLRHIDHIAGSIGSDYVGFGSDFDGIPQSVSGLESPRGILDLIDYMQKHYKEDDVRKFAGENYRRSITNTSNATRTATTVNDLSQLSKIKRNCQRRCVHPLRV